ncbi:MAG: aconitase family protein, partial [Desulfosalsimonas sp.]
ATSGICYPDMTTVDYLWPFIKEEYGTRQAALEHYQRYLPDRDAEYETTAEISIDGLSPQVTHGYRPDNVVPVSGMEGTPVDQVYIGSCTNGRIEDLRAAARVLSGRRISDFLRAIVSPATPSVYRKALEEGILETFMDAGFCVANPTCGACLGMSCGVIAEGEVCASTTNRNFYGRMGKGGMVHLMSPATAAATALAGHITNSELYEG